MCWSVNHLNSPSLEWRTRKLSPLRLWLFEMLLQTGALNTHTHTHTHTLTQHTHTHRLDSVLDNPLLSQIELGNYEYTNQNIRTGEHSGNHFRIAVRNVRPLQGNSENVRNIIPLAMEHVKKAGFVNYFGPQRFGGELSGARIGLAMLQGKHASLLRSQIYICLCACVIYFILLLDSSSKQL